MHRHGHIHRDIKTDNFRVHSDKVYLIDFGLETELMKDGKHIPIEEN
jgi:tRNA A-37 threonylcarbamoyl transferase component Bud32